jgi:hypothetical protein
MISSLVTQMLRFILVVACLVASAGAVTIRSQDLKLRTEPSLSHERRLLSHDDAVKVYLPACGKVP